VSLCDSFDFFFSWDLQNENCVENADNPAPMLKLIGNLTENVKINFEETECSTIPEKPLYL